MTSRKLKHSEIAEWRARQVEANRGRCALCQLPIKKPVADHCHTTGQMRDAICAGCNSLLGRVENNYRRYGVQNLAAFLHGAAGYLQRHATPQHHVLHPLHLTEEEKRERRNAAARRKRAEEKANKDS